MSEATCDANQTEEAHYFTSPRLALNHTGHRLSSGYRLSCADDADQRAEARRDDALIPLLFPYRPYSLFFSVPFPSVDLLWKASNLFTYA